MNQLLNQNQQQMQIFVVTHKQYNFPTDFIYIPIQVGYGEKLPNCLSDNYLDNIAHKNETYCELTALYFIWKNIQCPIVGLVHYRRYFVEKNPPWISLKYRFKYLLNLQKKIVSARYSIINHKYLDSIFQTSCDVIIPEPYHLSESLYENYAKFHHGRDWLIIREIIKDMYNNYLQTFDLVSSQNVLYPYNMFIGKKSIINQYCAWLFNILSHAENKIDYQNYDAYNKRVFGFLAERLFTVWIQHHYHDFEFKCIAVQKSFS